MKGQLHFHKNPPCIRLTRRELLKGAAILTGVIATGSAISMLAPSTTWAIETTTLSQSQADTIMTMGKALFPHKGLPDAVYAFLVKDIDSKAKESTDIAKLVAEGVNNLVKNEFTLLSEDKKVAFLKSIESTPFFQLIRGQCITSLYDNELAFIHFGYEGEVWSKGGYIARGFNDLKWLPKPPESASPSIK